jgi:hypothetical protein
MKAKACFNMHVQYDQPLSPKLHNAYRKYISHIHTGASVDLLSNKDMLMLVIGIACIIVGYYCF